MKTVNLNINGCLPQVRDGKDGKDGVNGKSAYDLWLANGNTGSEADFLESIKGPKGADGTNGTNGEKGEKGEKGDSLFEDAKLEDGKLVITKPDGSKLEVPVPACPDVLFIDAFGKVELGYSHSTTCEKSETTDPVEDTTEKTVIGVSASINRADATSITVNASKHTMGQPNPDPNTVIEGVAVAVVTPQETFGYKPVHTTPIERRVSFSVAYSEFPLTLSIVGLPSDALAVQGNSGSASHSYSARVENLSTSSTKVELREVKTTGNYVSGDVL
jgi:collagen triple helix repeat protein